MALLIDGYNLLHATGICPPAIGPGGLERARQALLNFIAESVAPAELARTTVVFDAGENAPTDRPRQVVHRGLAVRFAAKYEDADSLIEELIKAESAPRQLVVVSSDHRVQRAAKRRRAHAIDADRWYAQLLTERRKRHERRPLPTAKPGTPLSLEEVEYWLREFDDQSANQSPAAPLRLPEARSPEAEVPSASNEGGDATSVSSRSSPEADEPVSRLDESKAGPGQLTHGEGKAAQQSGGKTEGEGNATDQVFPPGYVDRVWKKPDRPRRMKPRRDQKD